MADKDSCVYVPVYATYATSDCRALEGGLSFTPTPERMVNGDKLTTVVGTTQYVRIGADGKVKVKLAATDDPRITPVNYTWKVVEEFKGGRTFYISTPMAYEDIGIDLLEVVAESPNQGLEPTVTRAEWDELRSRVNMLLSTFEGGDAWSSYIPGSDLDGGTA